MDIDAHDTVFRGDGFLRRAPKAVEALPQHNVLKTDLPEKRNELCLRQSASNSTRPEVDVPSNGFGQLVRHDDVAIEKLPAWLQNPEDFAERLPLIRGEV